ncbi:hypothetical protein [Ramlibacter sp. AN1133]|uniref:hypothetical protein n=1 Tax=Ramlibacter sp. AN1133 TaxID=3133429 RepID=UPI0030BC59E6
MESRSINVRAAAALLLVAAALFALVVTAFLAGMPRDKEMLFGIVAIGFVGGSVWIALTLARRDQGYLRRGPESATLIFPPTAK